MYVHPALLLITLETVFLLLFVWSAGMYTYCRFGSDVFKIVGFNACVMGKDFVIVCGTPALFFSILVVYRGSVETPLSPLPAPPGGRSFALS